MITDFFKTRTEIKMPYWERQYLKLIASDSSGFTVEIYHPSLFRFPLAPEFDDMFYSIKNTAVVRFQRVDKGLPLREENAFLHFKDYKEVLGIVNEKGEITEAYTITGVRILTDGELLDGRQVKKIVTFSTGFNEDISVLKRWKSDLNLSKWWELGINFDEDFDEDAFPTEDWQSISKLISMEKKRRALKGVKWVVLKTIKEVIQQKSNVFLSQNRKSKEHWGDYNFAPNRTVITRFDRKETRISEDNCANVVIRQFDSVDGELSLAVTFKQYSPSDFRGILQEWSKKFQKWIERKEVVKKDLREGHVPFPLSNWIIAFKQGKMQRACHLKILRLWEDLTYSYIMKVVEEYWKRCGLSIDTMVWIRRSGCYDLTEKDRKKLVTVFTRYDYAPDKLYKYTMGIPELLLKVFPKILSPSSKQRPDFNSLENQQLKCEADLSLG